MGLKIFIKRKVPTAKIVFEVKQAIARIDIMDTNIDHLYMEFLREAVKPIFTGRLRKEMANDFNKAIIIPAQPNLIRVFAENVYIDDIAHIKKYGLILYLYSLFTYSLKRKKETTLTKNKSSVKIRFISL